MAWTLVFTLHYLVTSWLKGIVIVLYRLSSPQKLRPCIPMKKKTEIKKEIARARGTMEREKYSVFFFKEHSKSFKSSPGSAINREPQILPESYMAEASVVSFPLPSWPARFLFPFPQPPYDTKRPLWSWERAVSSYVCPGECYR